MNNKILATGISLSLAASLSGCTITAGQSALNNSNADEQVQRMATIEPSFAEEFIRQTLFERTGVSVIAECPDLMQGIEGDKFTCYACPELYAAPEAGGGYFYGPGTVEFRCDAAFEGFAVDYEVVNGEMILMMEEIRGATE